MSKVMGWLMMLPVVGVVRVLVSSRGDEYIWRVGLEWSLMTLLGCVLLWCGYSSDGGYQYEKIGWYTGSVEPVLGGVVLGIDGISLFFILLTGLLVGVCILVSIDKIGHLIKEFVCSMLVLEVLLIGVFSVLDLLGFYVLFESILIPMFMVVGIWGSREDKVSAAYYFFFYTLGGSVLMLLSIGALYSVSGSTDYLGLCGISVDVGLQCYVFMGLYVSLAVKVPKLPFHIWLPQAHVEAPLAGSIILAGVLLKLGGYGFMRFSWPLLPEASEYYGVGIVTLGVLAVVYGSLTTCRQVDMKRVVAYSSIAHMGLVSIGIFSETMVGLVGSMILMLAHGLVSSGLFIGVTWLYDRYGSRLIRYYRGMVVTMPLFGVYWLMMMLANASIPLSGNFVGEFMCLVGAWECSVVVCVLGSWGIVLSAGYSLYMYNRVCFGYPSRYIRYPRDLSRREWYSVVPLVILVLVLGLYPGAVVNEVRGSILWIEA